MHNIENYTKYQQRKISIFRKIIRDYYLNRVLNLTQGAVIDFGCGIGNSLLRLPKSSVGLEVNPANVNYCQKKGLDVRLYKPQKDNYQLLDFDAGVYSSLLIRHVLEHLDNPKEVLIKLMTAAKRLKIRWIVLVVPGKKGFHFDITHKTFINSKFFDSIARIVKNDYIMTMKRFFPINILWIENFFIHHEYQVMYKLKNAYRL